MSKHTAHCTTNIVLSAECSYVCTILHRKIKWNINLQALKEAKQKTNSHQSGAPAHKHITKSARFANEGEGESEWASEIGSTHLNCILEQTNNLRTQESWQFLFLPFQFLSRTHIMCAPVFHTHTFHAISFLFLLLFISMVFSLHIALHCFALLCFALNKPYQLSVAFWVNCWDAQCILCMRGDSVLWWCLSTLIVVWCDFIRYLFPFPPCNSYGWSFLWPAVYVFVSVHRCEQEHTCAICKMPVPVYVCICACKHVSSPIRISK